MRRTKRSFGRDVHPSLLGAVGAYLPPGSRRISNYSIQSKTQFENSTFDRVLTVHVLEHLPNLPAALLEIIRILKDDGCFDVVIPCEGGLAYSIARKISAQRYFEKTFKMDYLPIVKSEHINTFPEIMAELKKYFKVEQSSFFPLKVPFYPINLCTAMRLTKIKI
jgi:SAM-dependent methyltransferase